MSKQKLNNFDLCLFIYVIVELCPLTTLRKYTKLKKLHFQTFRHLKF